MSNSDLIQLIMLVICIMALIETVRNNRKND